MVGYFYFIPKRIEIPIRWECQEICVSNFIKLSKNYRNDLYRVYIGHFIFLNIFGFLLKIYHPSLIDS